MTLGSAIPRRRLLQSGAALLLIAGTATLGSSWAQTAKKDFIAPVQADASSTAVKVPANQHLIFLAGHTASKPAGSTDYGSFDDQVKLFSEAAIVLGPHGAGLANAIFTDFVGNGRPNRFT